jgi:hypothetical protein
MFISLKASRTLRHRSRSFVGSIEAYELSNDHRAISQWNGELQADNYEMHGKIIQ